MFALPFILQDISVNKGPVIRPVNKTGNVIRARMYERNEETQPFAFSRLILSNSQETHLELILMTRP